MEVEKIVESLKRIPICTYYSIFKVGSAQEILKKGRDLDLIFVIKESKKNKFFNNTIRIIQNLKKKDKSLDYTLFRGPIKYMGKKLIHMVVYTRKQFRNEYHPILKSYLKSVKKITGLNIRNLLKNLKFNKISQHQLKMEQKWKKILQENKINYPEWIKTKNGWDIKRTEVNLNNFQHRYWRKYISKFKTKIKPN